MRKYSSEDKIDFKDASKELQNLFIFHTPTIKEGVDCSFPNPQDVFLHITGNSICPNGLFQMSMRTRNIKRIYMYGIDKNKKIRNTTIKKITEWENKLGKKNWATMSKDELEFYKGKLFYEMRIYNKYITNVHNVNKVKHLIKKYESEGMKIIRLDEGERVKLCSIKII